MGTRKNNTGLFKPGNKGKPKGTTNIITRTVKEAVLQEFNEQQYSPDRKWPLKKFANKYPRDFYAMAAKLIPTEIKANFTKVELKIVRTNPTDRNTITDIAPITENGNGHSETV